MAGSLDYVNFPLSNPTCLESDAWKKDNSTFFSEGYIGRFRLLSNVCVAYPHINLHNFANKYTKSKEFNSFKDLLPRMHFSKDVKGPLVRGTTLMGVHWPADQVGHQQECVFPMIQLKLDNIVDHLMYTGTSHLTPFIKGVLSSLNMSIRHETRALCFEKIAFCSSPGSGWHSIRESKLDPRKSGQHVIPTYAWAQFFKDKMYHYCNIRLSASKTLQEALY